MQKRKMKPRTLWAFVRGDAIAWAELQPTRAKAREIARKRDLQTWRIAKVEIREVTR